MFCRNARHLDYLNRLHMDMVVVSNSCNPLTMIKIFLCICLVLCCSWFLLASVFTKVDHYEDTIPSQILIIGMLYFNEYFFAFSVLFNSPDTQEYAKRKIHSYLKILLNKNPTANQPITIAGNILQDPVFINEKSSNELQLLKRRLLMHIHVECTVLYCMKAIFSIYEQNGFTVKGGKKMDMKTIFNDTQILLILAVYPPNSDVNQLLSNYCVMPQHKIVQMQACSDPNQRRGQNIHHKPKTPRSKTSLGQQMEDLEGMPQIV